MSELDGVFDAIEAGDNVIVDEPVQTEAVAEAAEAESTTAEATETKTDETSEEEVTPETVEPVKAETTETETQEPSKIETETSDAEVENWAETLPPPPVPYNGPVPEVNEEGVIVNMTPEQYATWQRETLKAELREESYQSFVENRSLEVAEKVLPEMKTNPLIRQMVQNARVASVMNGQAIDNVEAAKQVREALGIAPAKIAEAEARAAKNAKASITVQKQAALETSSTQKGPDTDKMDALQKRVQRGDDTAFVELLDIWTKSGQL